MLTERANGIMLGVYGGAGLLVVVWCMLLWYVVVLVIIVLMNKWLVSLGSVGKVMIGWHWPSKVGRLVRFQIKNAARARVAQL